MGVSYMDRPANASLRKIVELTQKPHSKPSIVRFESLMDVDCFNDFIVPNHVIEMTRYRHFQNMGLSIHTMSLFEIGNSEDCYSHLLDGNTCDGCVQND